MKILRTIESFYPFVNGPANQAFMISNELEKRSIGSPIFTTFYNAQNSPEEEEMENVKVRRFAYKGKLMKFIYTPAIKKAIVNEKPDIIHAHNYRSYQTKAAYESAKTLGIPFVINTHGSLLGYKSITSGIKAMPYRLFDLFEKDSVYNASAVIVSSEAEKTEALGFGIDESRLYVIPMGINVNEYQKVKRKRKSNKVRLLFVGRICRDRNIMPLLKVLKKMKDVELRVVGGEVKRSDTSKSGYLQELKDYARKNNLDVSFPGAIYGDKLKQEYKDADIFVYTSLWENFGQALLEAGASGLPVIATPVGIAQDIIKDGKTGSIVGFDELDELDKKLKPFLEPKKRKEAGRTIKKIIMENYKWEDIIMEYEKVYFKVSGRGKN